MVAPTEKGPKAPFPKPSTSSRGEIMKIYGMTVVLCVGVLALQTETYAQSRLTPQQQRHVSGFVSHELDQQRALAHPATVKPGATAYTPTKNDACGQKIKSNVKVNQNCLNLSDPDLQGRGQAQNETAIAQDPMNPSNLIASFNDYRRGDGTCGVAYSTNGGQQWNDSTTPNGFTRGTSFGEVARQYWQAGGDTSVAFDTKGNAYLDCQVFMRGNGVTNNPDRSSAVYVFRSTQNHGASFNFPGRPVVEDYDTIGNTLQDKPYMTVDNHLGSPFQDRIYVTWTNFAADGTANITESYSKDYGETFSAPQAISGRATFCNGSCNNNQDSQPFTGPDGTLYVVFNNFNNSVSGADNHNQVLMVKSVDGGATFSAPVLVANYYDLPDCYTYQGSDPFRACLPEKGSNTNSVFRADNYPSGGVNPKNGAVVVTFGSYISRNSNETTGCTPAGLSASTGLNLYTGTKVACSNQILLSVSTNAGASFTGTTTDPRSLPVVGVQSNVADEFFQWADFTQTGALAVSYYDRQYGNDATSGSLDVSASWSSDAIHFETARATSSSMPLPTQFPDGNGNSQFFGDYAGLSALNGIRPIWADTRNSDLFLCPGTGAPGVPPQLCTASEPNGLHANDQEIYTTTID
jgi:hypothetical protein